MQERKTIRVDITTKDFETNEDIANEEKQLFEQLKRKYGQT